MPPIYTTAPVPSPPSPAPTRPFAECAWRCRRCDRLLGVVHGAELHLRYKEAEHWVTGTCRYPCPRCRTTNVIHVGDGR
jgi:hypothetical protein